MTKPIKKELEIFTEKDIFNRFFVGRPFHASQIAFLLLKEGSINIQYNFKEFSLSGSTVLVIKPELTYEFLSIDSNSQIRIITFNSKFESTTAIKIRRFDYNSILNSSFQYHYILEVDEFMKLWQTTELLHYRLMDTSKLFIKKEIIHHLFLAFFYQYIDISGKYNQIKLAELSRYDKLTLKFIKLVSLHFREERGVSFYASKLNISPKHLSETVKLCSGFTAVDIINQAIINEAKILLANPVNTIKFIADNLNYSDQYAFSKFFKRLTLLTPSEYKRKM